MNPLKENINALLQQGTVIPAHPLALNRDRKLDERRQRALTRYYMASGAGGIAVGVHTTQFEIRNPKHALYEPVLALAAEVTSLVSPERPFIKVAGLAGPDDQAQREADTAVKLGYDLGLLSMGGLNDKSESELIRRAEKIGETIPLFGFYLQPAAGGRVLSYDFWKEFAELPNVHAIKIAPFNRYETLNVVRAVCCSSRHNRIALYTGNDDNIIMDLLSTWTFQCNGTMVSKSIIGGLLGQWAVWTSKAVELFNRIREIRNSGMPVPLEIIKKANSITDANAAIFDADHNFKGCIPGIHEILKRQGFLEGTWCLDPEEKLSKGQADEISRVYHDYPELNDDEFVREHSDEWFK